MAHQAALIKVFDFVGVCCTDTIAFLVVHLII